MKFFSNQSLKWCLLLLLLLLVTGLTVTPALASEPSSAASLVTTAVTEPSTESTTETDSQRRGLKTEFSGDIDFAFAYNDVRSDYFDIDANIFLFSSLLNVEMTPRSSDEFESPWTFYLSYQLTALDRFPVDKSGADLDPYRYWARYVNEEFEIKAGMQKIAFGHCRYLRPLQLFDRINPNDFTKKTQGTKSFLAKGYPKDDLQLFGWVIHNEENSEDFHYGGRANKVFDGVELALTYHHWEEDIDHLREDIYGFDAFADVTVGLWLEHATHKVAFGDDWNQTTLGVDYTFPNFWNGLHLSIEHMITTDDSYSAITNNTALFFNTPLSDEDTLFSSFVYDQMTELKSVNLRVNRDLSDTMTGVFSLDWANKDIDQLFVDYGQLVPLRKGASIRLVYSF